MESNRDFREMDVYRTAMEPAAGIFEISQRFPAEERTWPTHQARRSSRSVCANIAEVWRKRYCQNAFAATLSDAEAEAAASGVWLALAVRCG